MKPTVKFILILNLSILAVLVFVYPHLMVSPGKLNNGHKEIELDCFACHDVFLGASSQKCTSCHKVGDIGLRTTKGIPIFTNKTNVAFHQKLIEQDCVACHSDHKGLSIYRKTHKFTHALLDAPAREQCVDCHLKPKDDKHKQVSDQCSQCHSTEKWKPAVFEHSLLKKSELEQCTTCHKNKAPSDKLHQQSSEKCGQCHGTTNWKPATFDHAKWFRFDDQHERCTTCHRTPSSKEPNYKEYTCYFCHEHTPEKVRREHLEEGIRDFENCVSCHRSSDEDEAERAWEAIKRGLPYPSNQSFGTSHRRKGNRHDDDD